MPIKPSSSMLLVDSPSLSAFQHPPQTLSGLTAFLSAIGHTPYDGPPTSNDDAGQTSTLIDMMEQAAADRHTDHCLFRSVIQPALLQALVVGLSDRSTRLRLSLACSLGNTPDMTISVPAKIESIVQIQWQATAHLPDLGFFKAFSRAGIWNHLILEGQAATPVNRNAVARQPNLIHSWEAVTDNGRDTGADDGYGGLPALPGRPLWQVVNDPVHRFMLVDRFGGNWLLRSRADSEKDRIITLGEAMTFHFCPPEQLPDGALDEICAMVAAGGTVAATHVRFNLEQAYRIGYVLENGIIVGNSSLKHPRPQYIDTVRRQSGLDLSGFVERGYTSVRPEYRGLGIGTRLLEGLTARAGDRKIFSVIAEDNEATKIIARRNRTRQVASYYSEKAGKPVGIWMPEWMIDEHGKKRS